MTQPQQNPWDVVEYWYGHEHAGLLGPYDAIEARRVDNIFESLHGHAFAKFRLRNGQIIRVRPKR